MFLHIFLMSSIKYLELFMLKKFLISHGVLKGNFGSSKLHTVNNIYQKEFKLPGTT